MILQHPRFLSTIVLFAGLALPAAALAGQPEDPPAYHLNALINPSRGQIAVSGTVDVSVPFSIRTLTFALQETFAISSLRVNGRGAAFFIQSEQHTPLRPASNDIVVTLPRGSSPGRIHLGIAYAGKLQQLPEFGASHAVLSMDDQINARIVELATYSSWYPQFSVFGQPIQVDLQLTLPEGWTAVCSGRKLSEHTENGRSVTHWSSAKDTDIVVAAAPNYKVKSARMPGGRFEIYYTRLPNTFVETEMAQIEQVMQFYTARFGPTVVPGGVIRQVYSPKSHGQGRAGFARPGLIVTSEGITLSALAADRNFSLLQDVAHEMGHFWWNFGAGQGDWINETFAEYSSAMAVERVISRDRFNDVLEHYRQQVESLPASAPSLATVPSDGSNFVVRYYKGSLMLDNFRQVMGDERFFAAERAFFERYRGTPTGTVDFRAFWQQQLESRKALVDIWLDSRGGLPHGSDLTRADRSRLPQPKTDSYLRFSGDADHRHASDFRLCLGQSNLGRAR